MRTLIRMNKGFLCNLNDLNSINLCIVLVTILIAKLFERLYDNISFVEESLIVDK